MINYAISWLRSSHIIGYASKSIDCDYLNIVENRRFYFLDVGIAHHFVDRAGADEATIRGIVAENFVYLTLLRHILKDIAGNAPVVCHLWENKWRTGFLCEELFES